MRSLYTVFLLLALTPCLRAAATPALPQQGTVTVLVLHRASAPLADAVVQSGTVVARTDNTGRATLRLDAGMRTLEINRIGFAAGESRVTVRTNSDTTVTVVLVELPATLAEVVVASATRSGRRIEAEPVRVEVIGKEEVEEKLLMTPGDITMLLNETGGLRVQTTSPSMGGANVRVQGLRGRYTQILSDGLPLYGGQTGGLGLLQIPPMDLGGVEILKGVSSALYGSSALGGVINLISRRPEDEPVRELLINQTAQRGTDLVAFLASSVAANELGFTLLAGAHRQSQLDRDDDNWTDIPAYERLMLRPRAFWSDGEGRNVMLTAGYTGEDRTGGSMPGTNAPDGSPFPEMLRTRRMDAGGIGTFAVADNGALTLRASGSLQDHSHQFGPTRERDEHLTWFGEAAYTFFTGENSYVIGGALHRESYESSDVAGFDFTHTTPGIFTQGTFQLAERLSATASLRYDDHSDYGGFVSPRASILFIPFGEWSVRASFGSGYFAPTPLNETTEVTGLSVLEPLPDLRAERATSGSVDLGGVVGPLELNLTVFGSSVRHPVAVRAASGNTGRIEVLNVDGATRTSGSEVLARWNPEPFHVTASYTYVRSTEVDVNTGVRRKAVLTPTHQAGIVGAWEREGRSRVGVEVYVTGSQLLDDDAYRTTGNATVHLGVLAEQRFGRARVFINAENLLDYRQTKYDPLLRPERGLGGRWTNDVWAPLDGRVANVGVRFDF